MAWLDPGAPVPHLPLFPFSLLSSPRPPLQAPACSQKGQIISFLQAELVMHFSFVSGQNSCDLALGLLFLKAS